MVAIVADCVLVPFELELFAVQLLPLGHHVLPSDAVTDVGTSTALLLVLGSKFGPDTVALLQTELFAVEPLHVTFIGAPGIFSSN